MTQENLYVLGFRAGARDRDDRIAFWRRSAIGTWLVNLLLSAVVLWLWLR